MNYAGKSSWVTSFHTTVAQKVEKGFCLAIGFFSLTFQLIGFLLLLSLFLSGPCGMMKLTSSEWVLCGLTPSET